MTIRVVRTLVLLLAVLGVFAWPVLAQSHGQGNPHKQKGQGREDRADRDEDQDRDDGDNTRPIFRKHDREIIIEFYRSRPSGLPPGLAKRNGNLPPGLEKHLERNGTLPPGLQKRVEPLPPELDVRLPRLPTIYRRCRIGPHVIILNRKTSAILDIIRGVAIVAGT
ncbi:MAG: hypothetical protein HY237_01325 [Acidobacteria bacterium]|nr:hypothetical protein [Acidobacteriota bacterium]